ncbi:lysophospholipid acyltransferase family protein [Falsiporphyromonas endometrii]|uniref:Lysophospholipid acyltransferase family protein n=1 Tax=Falsiporphyromonas endometrii TaxID=1387297 RepID=A0ABV9K998_9PORP
MKKEVLTEEDVKAMFPAFNKPKRERLIRTLLKKLKITDINEVHAKHIHLRGAEFAHAALSDSMIDIKYEVHGKENLQLMTNPGAFVTVSNHPFGSIDGIMLIDIVGSIRPDYGVLVNGFLSQISCLRDSFIPIKPLKGISGDTKAEQNASGIRELINRISNGHPVGLFPAGGISIYNTKRNSIMDVPWQESCAKMILHKPVPVFPIFFEGRNSLYFHFLGWLSWAIRSLRIPAELFNKRGQTMHVHIGKPISPDIISQFKGKPRELSLFLYDRTYSLKSKK